MNDQNTSIAGQEVPLLKGTARRPVPGDMMYCAHPKRRLAAQKLGPFSQLELGDRDAVRGSLGQYDLDDDDTLDLKPLDQILVIAVDVLDLKDTIVCGLRQNGRKAWYYECQNRRDGPSLRFIEEFPKRSLPGSDPDEQATDVD